MNALNTEDLTNAFAAGRVAHIVIDVQNFYCDPAMTADRSTPSMTRDIVGMTDRIAAFCSDTRGRMRRAWVAHVNDRIMPCQALWARTPEYIDGMALREIPAGLVGGSETVVAKSLHSAFHPGTTLHGRLQKDDVDTLALSGFFTDQCVRATAYDALAKGYKVCILRDLTGPEFSDDSMAWLSLKNNGALVLTADAFRKACGIVPSLAGTPGPCYSAGKVLPPVTRGF